LNQIRLLKEGVSPEAAKKLQNEFNILRKFDHPNIIKLYDSFAKKDKFYNVYEYSENGTLTDYLNKVKYLEEGHASFIIYQILKAVNYCHKNKIMHRNIKPDNIYLSEINFYGDYTVKLGDFSSNAPITPGKNNTQFIGSNFFISPQVLNGSYNEKCDIWSIGVLFYLLISGTPPFVGNTHEEMNFQITNDEVKMHSKKWDYISKDCKDLIFKLLNKNEDERISAEEALSNSLFNKFHKSENISNDVKTHLMEYLNNILNYKNELSKLLQMSIALIIHNNPPFQQKELIKIFNYYDKNGDGLLSKEDFRYIFSDCLKIEFRKSDSEIELSKDEVDFDRIFQNCDTNKTGSVSFEEFTRACCNKTSILSDENNLQFLFNKISQNSEIIKASHIKSLFENGDKEISLKLATNIYESISFENELDYQKFKEYISKLLQEQVLNKPKDTLNY